MLARLCLTYSLLVLVIISTGCSLKLVNDVELKNAISYSLEMAGDSIWLGKQAYVSFIIVNESDRDIFIDNDPHGNFYEGTHLGGFQISARKANGEILNSIFGQHGGVGSGRYGITKIRPFKKCVILIPILSHIDIKTPGKYELYVNKSMNIYFDKRKRNNAYDYGLAHKIYKKRIVVHESLSISFEVVKEKS